MNDNVLECRKRLFQIFERKYDELFKDLAKCKCIEAIEFVLKHNIVQGDFLLMSTGKKDLRIQLSEWKPVNKGKKVSRRVFYLHELLVRPGEFEFSPEPIEFEDIDYRKIADAQKK